MLLAADRLARAKARPVLVEHVIRTALRDAIAWRIGGGAAPESEALGAAAVVATRQLLDARAADVAELSRTLSAVQAAARTFTQSKLWHRLMSVPTSRFIRLEPDASGPDAIIRDRHGRVHVVALRFTGDAFAAGSAALHVAQSTRLAAADRLAPLHVHIFCLRTKRRHAFQLDVAGHRAHLSIGYSAA